MELIVYGLLLIISTYIITKKTQYTITLVLMISSLSPILTQYISNGMYNILYIYIFLVLLYYAKLNKQIKLTKGLLIYLLGTGIILIINILSVNVRVEQIVLFATRFYIFPFIAYVSVKYMKEKNKTISSIFLLYFLVNIAIVYYRIFIDFSVGGLFFNIGPDHPMFRPSNLNSPIVFSIELAVFIVIYMIENNKFIYKCGFLIIIVIPMISMSSRSSLVFLALLLIVIIYKRIKNKRIIIFFSIFSLWITCFLSLFIIKIDSMLERFISIGGAFKSIYENKILFLLFGRGSGVASIATMESGIGEVYVENFFMTLLIEYGVLLFLVFIIFNFISLKQKKIIFVDDISRFIIVGIFIVNLISSNLSANSVQLLYWFLIFNLITNTVEKREKYYG